jgi:hypothetical protein
MYVRAVYMCEYKKKHTHTHTQLTHTHTHTHTHTTHTHTHTHTIHTIHVQHTLLNIFFVCVGFDYFSPLSPHVFPLSYQKQKWVRHTKTQLPSHFSNERGKKACVFRGCLACLPQFFFHFCWVDRVTSSKKKLGETARQQDRGETHHLVCARRLRRTGQPPCRV